MPQLLNDIRLFWYIRRQMYFKFSISGITQILFFAISVLSQGCNFAENDQKDALLLTDSSTGVRYRIEVFHADTKGEILLLQSTDTVNTWRVGFPVMHCFIADANGDGQDDVLFTTVKPTRRDTVHHLPRPHIITLRKGRLRPLWLGSTFGYPMIAYKVKQPGILWVVMQTPDSDFMLATYRWRGFAPVFHTELFRSVQLWDVLAEYLLNI
jgi:hypothetical protein